MFALSCFLCDSLYKIIAEQKALSRCWEDENDVFLDLSTSSRFVAKLGLSC